MLFVGFLEWWSEFAPEVHYTKNEGKPGYFPPFDDRKTDNRIGQGAGTHWRVLGSLGLQPEHVWGCSLDARGEGSCVPAHIQPRRPDLEQASAGPTRSPCRHSTSPSVRPTSSLTRSRGRTASPTHMRAPSACHHGAMHAGAARTSRMFTRAKARKARGVRYSLIAQSRSKPTPIMLM